METAAHPAPPLPCSHSPSLSPPFFPLATLAPHKRQARLAAASKKQATTLSMLAPAVARNSLLDANLNDATFDSDSEDEDDGRESALSRSGAGLEDDDTDAWDSWEEEHEVREDGWDSPCPARHWPAKATALNAARPLPPLPFLLHATERQRCLGRHWRVPCALPRLPPLCHRPGEGCCRAAATLPCQPLPRCSNVHSFPVSQRVCCHQGRMQVLHKLVTFDEMLDTLSPHYRDAIVWFVFLRALAKQLVQQYASGNRVLRFSLVLFAHPGALANT